MKEKLPVVLENLDLPVDDTPSEEQDNSRGFVTSVLLIGLVTASWSIAAIIFLMNR